MGGVKIVPDLTIIEQGAGSPAQDVWPDTAAGSSGAFPPPGALFGQVLTTQGPAVAPTSQPLSAEWISPTNNPTWTQATWFIDPSNVTGLASDLNSGVDALHPVLSYRGGVVAKWGTTSPRLAQDTTITWLSSQPITNSTGDPVNFSPVIASTTAVSGPAALVIVQGVLNATTQVHAGALGAVVPKNRATPQLLTADLGFAAPIGTLIQNTTAGKSSFATVYQNVAGTVFALSQPSTPQTAPVTSPTVEVDTWAPGDTFVAYALVLIDLVQIGASAVDGFIPPNATPPLQVQFIRGNGGPNGLNTTVGSQVAIVQSTFDLGLALDTPDDDVGNFYEGVGAIGGVFDGGRNPITVWATGFILSPFESDIAFGNIGWDAILDATASSGLFVVARSELDFGVGGGVYITGSVIFEASTGAINVSNNVIWGPGGLGINANTHVYYTNGLATVTFLQKGTTATSPPGAPFGLNELTTAYAIGLSDPAPWHPGRALTAANLDLSVAGGGFGGLAVSPGGASITTNP
jgi:hypothetical protein